MQSGSSEPLCYREIRPGDFTIDQPHGDDIQFMEHCMADGADGLNILLYACCNVDEVLGTNVETGENEDWVNVYINVSQDYEEISPIMEVTLNRGDGGMESLERPLTEKEQAVLLNMAQRFELIRLNRLIEASQQRLGFFGKD